MMQWPKQRVSFIEYGIFNYPKGLEGWRCYRMEIGGHAEDCLKECTVWLPPNLSVSVVEDIIQSHANEGGPDTRSL